MQGYIQWKNLAAHQRKEKIKKKYSDIKSHLSFSNIKKAMVQESKPRKQTVFKQYVCALFCITDQIKYSTPSD